MGRLEKFIHIFQEGTREISTRPEVKHTYY